MLSWTSKNKSGLPSQLASLLPFIHLNLFWTWARSTFPWFELSLDRVQTTPKTSKLDKLEHKNMVIWKMTIRKAVPAKAPSNNSIFVMFEICITGYHTLLLISALGVIASRNARSTFWDMKWSMSHKTFHYYFILTLNKGQSVLVSASYILRWRAFTAIVIKRKLQPSI